MRCLYIFCHICCMDGKFAITLTHHRVLGHVFQPVVLNRVKGKEFYSVHYQCLDMAAPFTITLASIALSSMLTLSAPFISFSKMASNP